MIKDACGRKARGRNLSRLTSEAVCDRMKAPMKERTKTILIFAALIVAAAVLILFERADFRLCADGRADRLWKDTIPRFTAGAAAGLVACLAGYGKLFAPERKGAGRALIWCLPPLAVAIVNFPFSALASGAAVVERNDLLWLFALKCISIGLMEELLFRGILFPVIGEMLGKRRYGGLIAAAISSAVFALYHLFNLLAGADVGATFLQVGYSFLTGGMFAAVLLRTRNLWACVGLHALFDFGGLLITDLGSGSVHDAIFWVLTAVAALICLIHVLFYLYRTPTASLFSPAAAKKDEEQ